MIQKLILPLVVLVLLSSNTHAVPVAGENLVISGPQAEAVAAGLEIADQGGNVIDVAVAVALALSVTNPNNASLGGGGFAMIRMKGETLVLDFRETAPAATNEKTYLAPGASSENGGLAVGTPGIPAGLAALHEKFGSRPWKSLFAPALRLAEKGFRVTRDWSDTVTEESSRFNQASREIFLKKDSAFAASEIHRQPRLLKALQLFQKKKAAGFYTGPVARDLAATVQKNGGVLTVQDLEKYRVRWLKPLTADFYGHKLYLMPPPSSGGVVLKTAFALTERVKPMQKPALGVDETHLFTEILSRAFRFRSTLGDPDFHRNPLELIFSDKELSSLASGIQMKKASKLDPLPENFGLRESNQTTNFSILARNGDALVMTITHNGNFGSGLVTEKFGITLNNEMDDFTTRPGEPNMFGLIQGEANRVQPGKRPLSSMSPTLVEKDGRVVIAVGAPGGPRIITAVFHTIYRSLVNGWNIDEAIQAPRVHHQFLPNKATLDERGFAPEVVEGLRARGHDVVTGWQGLAYGVKWDEKAKRLEGAFDARGEGSIGAR